MIKQKSMKVPILLLWLQKYEEGVEEGIKKVAINLLKLGLDKEDISKTTGLSLDEINKLA